MCLPKSFRLRLSRPLKTNDSNNHEETYSDWEGCKQFSNVQVSLRLDYTDAFSLENATILFRFHIPSYLHKNDEED